jgi:hypothetical protein
VRLIRIFDISDFFFLFLVYYFVFLFLFLVLLYSVTQSLIIYV